MFLFDIFDEASDSVFKYMSDSIIPAFLKSPEHELYEVFIELSLQKEMARRSMLPIGKNDLLKIEAQHTIHGKLKTKYRYF